MTIRVAVRGGPTPKSAGNCSLAEGVTIKKGRKARPPGPGRLGRHQVHPAWRELTSAPGRWLHCERTLWSGKRRGVVMEFTPGPKGLPPREAEQHQTGDFMGWASPDPGSPPPPPPPTRARHVGWHAAAGDPPGTLRWWNGQEYVVLASWALDHWNYESAAWSGTDPSLGVLPDGAAAVQESGWWLAAGHWHSGGELPLPPPPSTSSSDPSLGFGVAGVVVESLVWVSWVLAFIAPTTFASGALRIVPLGTPIGMVLGLAALRHARRGRMLGRVALAMGLASMAAISATFAWFVIGALSGNTLM
jgi:hypothetical protein